MGSVEGELLETYLQTRFLMVKPWKGVKKLAVGAREVVDLGMWELLCIHVGSKRRGVVSRMQQILALTLRGS